MTAPDLILVQPSAQKNVEEMIALALTEEIKAAAFDSPVSATIVKDLLTAAKRHIGARYSRGSAGPKAFDCSGFTSYVYKSMGISLKRSSQEQYTQGRSVNNIRDMLPGDLVFFGLSGRQGKNVNHVGIVTDVNYAKCTFRFIHSSTSQGVRIDSSTDEYWTHRFINARRIIGND